MEKKIICLDDCEITLKKVEKVFVKAGYKVYLTSSWAEVNNFIFKEKAEILLCDVNLPGISGDKICKVIRESIPQVKVVFFSSLPADELESLAQQSGAHAYLQKSSMYSTWVETIEEIYASTSAKKK